MKKVSSALLIALCFTMLSSCSREIVLYFKPAQDQIFTDNLLKKIIGNSNKPSILLYVPSKNTFDFTYGKGTNLFINTIENALIKEGYPVRDRGLFDKVLENRELNTYSQISDLSQVDIIIEIFGIDSVEFSTNTVTTKNRRKKVIPECDFKANGWRFDFRIINVSQNLISGVYALYQTPCVNGCHYTLGRNCKWVVSEKNYSKVSSYETYTFAGDNVIEFADNVAEEMLKILR